MAHRSRLLVVTTAAGSALVLAAAVLAAGAPLAVDRTVAAWFAGDGGWRGPARVVTQLGAGPVVYPLLALLCLLTAPPARRSRWTTYLPVALLAAAQVLEVVLTAPFVRVGPDGGDPLSSSLSSGHAAAAVVGWGLAAVVIARRRPAARVVVAPVAAVVALAVAVTRVALGLHWISDVALGVLVGVALLGAAVTVLDHVDRRAVTHRPHRRLRRGTTAGAGRGGSGCCRR